jgi:hypothetical protein
MGSLKRGVKMILMGSIKMNLCPFIITSYNVIGENVEKPV